MLIQIWKSTEAKILMEFQSHLTADGFFNNKAFKKRKKGRNLNRKLFLALVYLIEKRTKKLYLFLKSKTRAFQTKILYKTILISLRTEFLQ